MWGRDSQEFLAHVLSSVYTYNDCDAVLLCNDFNSRIGSMADVSDFNNANIPPRQTFDKTLYQHGHSFLEFLNEAKMCLLNGRFDESENNYTSVSTRGKAVVDYICVPHEVFENCRHRFEPRAQSYRLKT